MQKHSARYLTIAALLVALGIAIPSFVPKIVIGPASYTLASHVPVFIAMFFSPLMAVAVSIATAIGFFLTLPPVIGLRALSHVVFALIGAYYMKKTAAFLLKDGKPTLANGKFQLFNVIIGVIHAVVEAIVVAIFYLTGNVPGTVFDANFFLVFLVGLIGIGGFIHSLIDYNIAYFISGVLSRRFEIPAFEKAKQEVAMHANMHSDMQSDMHESMM